MDLPDLAYSPVARQAELIAAGELSARDLLEVYLERIERLNPTLNAFRVVFRERARLEAEQADARRAAAADREQLRRERPLLGVPVAIKDDADIAGERTCFGTRAVDAPAPTDSEVVRRLRAAGAIPIGKTNVPELTLWPFSETPTFGATRNPWNVQYTPGGSSGGSAAAVAAGLAGAALGSDGLGSIRIPASFCGLYGLKPQRERISSAPHESAGASGWYGLAVYGPLARSVADAALFLDATAQTPPEEGTFSEAAAREPGRLRIALSTKPFLPQPVDAQVLEAARSTAELLRSLGHEVVERDPDYPPWLGPHLVARYLRGASGMALEIGNVARMERRSRQIVALGRLVGESGVQRALASEGALAARLGRLFEDCDVLLTPTLARAALPIGTFESRGAVWTMQGCSRIVPFLGVWNATGQPAASLPAGRTREGVPIGVQLVGRPYDEATLLALSAQLEAARPWADERPPDCA
jgi:amidase